MIYGTVNGQHLRITSTVTAADTYRMLAGRFSFSEEWRGLTKIAYFRRGRETYPFLLVRDAIPADAGLNLTAGDWEAAISGYKLRNIAELDEQTAPRLTTNIAALHVDETVAPGDGEFPVIPKTLGEQILAVAEDAAATAADVKRRADEGEFDGYTPVKGVDYFDGKDGYTPVKGVDYRDGVDGYTPVKGVDYFDGKDGYTPVKGVDYRDGVDGYNPVKGVDYFDGLPGKDGYSPSATVERTSDGALITITDKSGTTTAKVNDGQGGGGGVTDEHIKEVAETESIKSALADKADKSEIPDVPVDDVQINGTSILADGVADIPIAAVKTIGVVAVPEWSGLGVFPNGNIYTVQATHTDIQKRFDTVSYKVITPRNIDNAVKLAMCDGKGAAWTEEEQLAAQARLGIISSEGVGF